MKGAIRRPQFSEKMKEKIKDWNDSGIKTPKLTRLSKAKALANKKN